MKSDNVVYEDGRRYDDVALEKQDPVAGSDTLLTQGHEGNTKRGLKSRHIQFLCVWSLLINAMC